MRSASFPVEADFPLEAPASNDSVHPEHHRLRQGAELGCQQPQQSFPLSSFPTFGRTLFPTFFPCALFELFEVGHLGISHVPVLLRRQEPPQLLLLPGVELEVRLDDVHQKALQLHAELAFQDLFEHRGSEPDNVADR